MKLSSILGVILLSVILVSCGTPSSPTAVVPKKNTITSPKEAISVATGSTVSNTSKSQSGSTTSATGSEDPEVKAIMNDLDNMFESVASE